jgi:AraC-like DNA-binding protein
MGKEIRLTYQLLVTVTRVKEYIDEHPLEKKTTTELAEYAGISRNLLQKAFKELYSTHIKEYYTAQKMGSAMLMLKEGMTVRQVARQCRYRSHSAFTTAFRNKFGITPLNWLKQN